MKNSALAILLLPFLAALLVASAQTNAPPGAQAPAQKSAQPAASTPAQKSAQPAAAAQESEAAPAKPMQRATRRVPSTADARVCLEFQDNLQVMKCAEKYRWAS